MNIRRVALTGLAAAMVAPWILAGPAIAAPREPALRYSFNGYGNVEQAGNTLLTCPDSESRCAGAQAGDAVNNNIFRMRWVDVDADPGTFNSSTARVHVPPGSTVDFAGLYWGGDAGVIASNPAAARCSQPATSATLPPAPGQADRVLVNLGTGYASVTADAFDFIATTGGGRPYQGFADVTPMFAGVQRPPALTPIEVTVANVQLAQGTNCGGGWSIVLAYTYPVGADPDVSPAPAYAPDYRNISIFDGFVGIAASGPADTITLDGFLTPLTGLVDAHLGVVAYEGDRGTVGATLSVNGVPLASSGGSTNNFFDSTVAGGTFAVGSGVLPGVGPVNPTYDNALGYDSKPADVPEGLIPNGASSATVRFATNGDAYRLGVFVFTARIQPLADVTKSVHRTASGVDANQQEVAAGERLTMVVVVRNVGDLPLTDAVLTDDLGQELIPVPGTLTLDGVPLTDAVDADAGSRTGGTYAVSLGAPAPAAVRTVTFDVIMAAGAPAGVPVVNRARLDYVVGRSLFSRSSQVAVIPIDSPAVGIPSLPVAGMDGWPVLAVGAGLALGGGALIVLSGLSRRRRSVG